MTHIVVLGAGYSGQIAANLAARRADATVTLVNDRDRFVERVRLHQFAAGQELRERKIADLLRGSGASLVVDRVTRIDPRTRTVELAAGEPLHYDTLIYALGSHADLESVPGVAEHAFTVAGAEQAVRLRDRLASGGTVTVVGGGLTGIEAATELAESHPDLKVRLLTGDVLGARLSERGGRYLRRTFDRLGIEIRDEVRVAAVRADGVELVGGEHVGSHFVVWTTGFTVPPLAREAGLAVDVSGRMIVDDTMRSVSHPDVYGIGDAAAVRRADGQELRMACATGLPVAQAAVRAVTARLAGKEPKPFRFRYVNQCISLGRRDGLIQFVRGDDSPKEAVLTGRLAALYKEVIVRGALQAQRHPAFPTAF
ncbi:MAG: oxidoreductase [Actinophytocola sp.]|uniref:NAD(P)/FAD-dependent oxidoreductase n=1 Tax=Actinophytocola sp. TaxID=1872138 RepID=UPI001321BC5B|nr:FAD-dependent oxidoreductase [Actinophytocola sp.]MPZ79225.1 oxidoreductase [Actinophytocola sp.]